MVIYKGTKVERLEPPRSHEYAIPRASCWIASTDGDRPLKTTSFRCSQIAHRLAKIVFHSAARRNGPRAIEDQKDSAVDTSRLLVDVARHDAWANVHSKNRCEQSSLTPPQSGHSAELILKVFGGWCSPWCIQEPICDGPRKTQFIRTI